MDQGLPPRDARAVEPADQAQLPVYRALLLVQAAAARVFGLFPSCSRGRSPPFSASLGPSPSSTAGAVGRVGRSATAFWHRNVQWDNFATSALTEPAESDAQVQWVRKWWDVMRAFSMGGEYVDNLGDEGEERVRASYGGDYERLVALTNKYDLTNFFRLNANIAPTV